MSLSDPEGLKQLTVDDFLINARGRRYFSNDSLITTLNNSATPIAEFHLGTIPSAKLYQLDQQSLTLLNKSAP